MHVLGAPRKSVEGGDTPGHDDISVFLLARHFFTSAHAWSGGPNALSPEIVVRIL